MGAVRSRWVAGADDFVRLHGMTDPAILIFIAGVFLLAGAVKGVIGVGLPSVSLGLLAAVMSLQPAIAITLAPALATNIWQGALGGHAKVLFRRLWPFLLAIVIAIGFGTQVLARVDNRLLSALLGFLLVIYGVTGLQRPSIRLPQGWEGWSKPVVGLVNGLITGMTGTFVVPATLYLQSLGLPRDQLIQAMGMVFGLSSLVLAIALGSQNMVSGDLALISLAAILPALIGMWLGERIRRRLSEALFRKVFFVSLILLGAYVVVRALVLS